MRSPDNTIEVRVEDISQLLHTLDPLSVSWAGPQSRSQNWQRDVPWSVPPLHIVVHLSQSRLSQLIA